MGDSSCSLAALHPLSAAQQVIFFEQALFPESPFYNIGVRCRIDGPVDPETFRQAAARLIQETDVLRLRLTESAGTPLQSFSGAASDVEVVFRDFSDAADPSARLSAELERAVRKPFQIFNEPLSRFALYRLAADRHVYAYICHHIVLDGWGLSLVTRRIAAIYTALTRGEPVPPPPGGSYLDLVEDDAAYAVSASRERHRQYWRETYATLPPPLLQRRAGHVDGTTPVPGGAHSWHLSRSCYGRLEALARTHSVSVFHVLLGLLYVYFTRIANQDECVVGIPILNRRTEAFKSTIGLFVGMLPARFSFGREVDFPGLLRAISQNLRESREARRLPISEIQRVAGSLSAGRKKLFDIALSFESYDHSARFGAAPPCETVILANGHEQTPLWVAVRDFSKDRDVRVDCLYNLAYFSPEDMVRTEARLRNLIEDVLADPARPLHRFDILPKAERRCLLTDWNATAAPVAADCVHLLFAAQAAKTPDAVALVCEDCQLSYAELDAQANRLAHGLVARGIRPDDPVAIALERSPAMIVALLGVLKAGAAYVPLDPNYPMERLRFMLADSRARLLITQTPLLGRLPRGEAVPLCLDAEAGAFAALPETSPGVAVSSDNLAYVIYTSGSTGTPKGVAVRHGGLGNFLAAMRTSPGLEARDTLLSVTTFAFDIFGLDVFLPLLQGGRIVLATADQASDPKALSELIEGRNVTVMQATPATWRMLVDAEWPGKPDLKMLIGGEALAGGLAGQLIRRGRSLWNLYGPTETTVWSTMHRVVPQDADGAVVPIGRPIANVRLYVLGGRGELAPIGVPGELFIGGQGLARGYFHRPELTDERFVPDPFGPSGGRLYRTGDLVRWRDDGTLEFLGRLDHQVKIRGFRIELGEIEASLRAHPGVRAAAVDARGDGAGERRLVGYVVPGDEAPAPGDLRAFLKTRLPDYMLPAAWVFLPALPLTPNGKLDRKALPEPEARIAVDATAPRDALEEILAGLWSEVLHLRAIGIHDNFFDLGGHSLLAAHLIAEIEKRLGKRLPMRALFEAPTIAGLASLLRHDGELPEFSCLVNIRSGGDCPPFFFVPGAGGFVRHLYPLARGMDERFPFFSFQAKGVDGKSPLHASIEEMAAHYVELLLEIQPRGPYYLGGHSLGGLVAFAMAQCLIADGHEIGLLAIGDTLSPEALDSENLPVLGDGVFLFFLVRVLFGLGNRTSLPDAAELANMTFDEALDVTARHLKEAGLYPEDTETDYLRNLFTVFRMGFRLQNAYHPATSSPVPVVLFRALEPLEGGLPVDHLAEDFGWSRYSTLPVSIRYVPGNHISMMAPPNVEELARALGAELAAAYLRESRAATP